MPAKLCYKHSDRWYAVPKWVEHFIGIGEELVLEDFKSSSRVVAAIVVPTRNYCAALISFGMVIGDTIVRDKPSKDAHFNKLLELQPGTSIVYHETNKKIRNGIICNPEEINGEYFIKFQISEPSKKGGGIFILISREKSFQVYPSTHHIALSKRRVVKEKISHNEFVNTLLPGCDLINFDTQSKFVCAIVGKKNLLEQEIVLTPFAVECDDSFIEGTLQDVLRVDNFTTGAQSHRSALISTGLRRQPSMDLAGKVETGVVFDGADAFLRWREMYPNRHQVVILDRTELYFDDAVHAINSIFSQNRINLMRSVPFSDIDPLAGTELLVFREEVQ